MFVVAALKAATRWNPPAKKAKVLQASKDMEKIDTNFPGTKEKAGTEKRSRTTFINKANGKSLLSQVLFICHVFMIHVMM